MKAENHEAELQEAIDRCASEQVHLIGKIQAHGALIAVHPESLCIVHASDNISDFLGRPAAEVLGKTLGEVFERGVKHALVNAMALDAQDKPVHDIGFLNVGEKAVFATACVSGDKVIFEFEEKPDRAPQLSASVNDLEFVIEQTRNVQDRQQLLDKSVQLLHMVTGYDRVMIYQFDEENNGQIIAEALSPGVESFLGLRFPAFDIPEQARAIIAQTKMRYIADTEAQEVEILAAGGEKMALDMTHTHLRAASDLHLEYLRNMGSQSTLTLHIKVQGRVWGLISLHHLNARYPDPRIRQLARNFTDVFSLKLDLLEQMARNARLRRADELRKTLFETSSSDGVETLFESSLLNELRDVMEVEGVALVRQGKVTASGKAPSEECILKLADDPAFQERISATTELQVSHPHLAPSCCPEIAGLLVTKLPDQCTFLFFRSDRAQVKTWAGAPDKSFKRENGVLRLTPRQSFAAYSEKVTGTSVPWSVENLRIADELWSILVTAERDELIRRTNRQQTLLIDELNHRVRNILALIRSLSQQSLSHNGSILSYVTALEARIAAVASAHDLGAEKSSATATVRQVLELEAAPYNQESTRVKIIGQDCGIRPDLTPMFALVFHELMTNAAKYGALSNDSGEVVIRIKRSLTGLRVDWTETGGPHVFLPVRKGFGTTLIETSVPHELNGDVKITHGAQGVSARFRIPNSVLTDKISVKMAEPNTSGRTPTSQPPCFSELVARDCLLVEDNYVVSLDTARVLGVVGFKSVSTALNIDDALARIDRATPGFAVLDVNLAAGETSAPIAQKLIAKSVPIIFVTGYGDTEALGPGYKDFPVLKKPLREDELRNALSGLAT